jgi:L-gulono-1,4-lactone dehydrogenase
VTTSWTNWAGNVKARATRVEEPQSVAEVVAVVKAAARDGRPVKAVGSGHSFAPIAATDGVRVELSRLSSLRAVDREARTVTVEAGMPLQRLNAILLAHGLGLVNMGDVAYQTVSGAISTGTHGSGRDSASLAQQVTALEIVLADGSEVTCSARDEPELFAAARLGLGAFGIITAVTFAVEPAYLLHAQEGRASLAATLDSLHSLVAANEHVDMHWLPFTDDVQIKRNNRTTAQARPLGRLRAWWEGQVVENYLLGAVMHLGRTAPAAVPAINLVSGRLISTRDYVDFAHRVYTSERLVRFVEMEYAIPRDRAVPALRALQRLVAEGAWRIGFPVQLRFAPADDVWLSTAYGQETVYVAVHALPRCDWQGYFAACEELFVSYGGRPHWGKLHSRDAASLAGVYPRFADALRVRDRVDPDRLFANAYLNRVLG